MLVNLQDELQRFGIRCRGVIQIGAHEGQEVGQYVGMGFAAIHLVEPNPEVFVRLAAATRDAKQVTLAEVAISDRNGEAALNIATFDQSSSLLDLKLHKDIFPGISLRDRVNVETRTLDDHLGREHLDPAAYNVLSVDTQGSELAILRGGEAYLAACDAILLEVNFAELYADCPEVEEIDAFLFDRGFIRVRTGLWSRHWGDALYVRSDRIADPFDIFDVRRGTVQIPDFGKNGRFANQLFQFAFAYFYALRAGANIKLPTWPEGRFFRVPPFRRPVNLPVVRLPNGNRDHLAFFSLAKPPRNLGFSGYFQDLPAAVKRHEVLFRRLFAFRPEIQAKLDRWFAAVGKGGARPVIALHVRHGDYPAVDPRTYAHARVPTAWCIAALRAELALQPDAYVHVATDTPAVAREILAAVGRADQDLYPCDAPDPIRDFHALRTAGVSLLCNSSFSRMAALLSPRDRKTLLVNFASGGFDAYDAWTDEAFWFRFSPPSEPSLCSVFDGCREPEEIERQATAMIVAADRDWREHNRFRLWRLTVGAYWATFVQRALRRLRPRRLRLEFLSLAAYRQMLASVFEYWDKVASGEAPPSLPRWRFFKEP